MTTHHAFTATDWDLLVGAPALIALVLIHAERCSPRMAERKLQVAFTAMREPVPEGPGSALIVAVTDAVRSGHSPRWPTEYPRQLTDVGGWALERCRQLTALLAQQAPAAEAEAYSHWLHAIAQQVTLVPEGQGLAEHVPTAPTHIQRSALDQLAVALDLPLVADEMCVASVCWRTSQP
ncbi:MAG: hypothetical protein HGA45_13700 [Chloroflexales bacterium]|nr:hypothetical protein [Chloroflexales bacterium]